MSVLNLVRIFLLVLPVLGAPAESEESEGSGSGYSGPPSSHTKPWPRQVSSYLPRYNPQWGPRPRPWFRPSGRQWSGPMGHVVPSFPQPSGLAWQPPPVIQQPPQTSGNIELLNGPALAMPPVQTVPMPYNPPQYSPGCGFSRLSPCSQRYNPCGAGSSGGCSQGYNPGTNNGNSGYNPGIEVDNSNDNSGYNPGFVQASNLPAGIEFDNSNSNNGYNPGMNNVISPCGGAMSGGCNSGFNPGMNSGYNPGYMAANTLPAGIEFDNGNSGFNPGYVPASNLPSGMEFDNTNGNSGFNPGFVPASNLPGGMEFDNSNGNSGFNPGYTTGNSYTPLPGSGNCYNVCGQKSSCGVQGGSQGGSYQQMGPGCRPMCRSKCNIQPACVGGSWYNQGQNGQNSFVCGQSGGGGFGYNPGQFSRPGQVRGMGGPVAGANTLPAEIKFDTSGQDEADVEPMSD